MRRTLALLAALSITLVAAAATAQTGTTDPNAPSAQTTQTTQTTGTTDDAATTQSPSMQRESLPDTASPWPTVAIAGLASLVLSVMLRRRRQ